MNTFTIVYIWRYLQNLQVPLWCFFFIFSFSACETRQPFSYDFETEASLDLLHWNCKIIFSLSDKHVTSGKKSLKMELYPSPYPGLTLKNFDPDWAEYHTLIFDAYNQEQTILNLTVRIDDKKNPSYADRYNKIIILNHGANTISIPLNKLITSETNREINLTRIQKMIMFLGNPEKKRTIYIDNVRLE